jgi:competence protein ComEC
MNCVRLPVISGTAGWRRVTLLVFVIVVGMRMRSASAARGLPLPSERRGLEIYFADVEGGQATLFVTPEGQSLLIDTGWPENGGRDADRIVQVAKKAGTSKLDFVLITHFHTDHVGGAPKLADRIPITAFIDHGENRENTDGATVRGWDAYQTLLASGKYKRIVVKPGDALPIQGIQATVISSDGVLIKSSLPGAGQRNANCGTAEHYPADQTENARSVGILVSFGKLKILDLGDLPRDKEMELMCPVNRIGHADIYIVSHHGWYQSGTPALVNAIASRVAIMDNGAKKGGSPSAWDALKKAPGLEDLWQLHYSEEGGASHNAPEQFIANPNGPDGGNYLKLTAWPDGHFEVFNARTQQRKEYAAH